MIFDGADCVPHDVQFDDFELPVILSCRQTIDGKNGNQKPVLIKIMFKLAHFRTIESARLGKH